MANNKLLDSEGLKQVWELIDEKISDQEDIGAIITLTVSGTLSSWFDDFDSTHVDDYTYQPVTFSDTDITVIGGTASDFFSFTISKPKRVLVVLKSDSDNLLILAYGSILHLSSSVLMVRVVFDTTGFETTTFKEYALKLSLISIITENVSLLDVGTASLKKNPSPVYVSSSSPTTQLGMWVGTSDEYEAITDKDSNTIYFVKSSS